MRKRLFRAGETSCQSLRQRLASTTGFTGSLILTTPIYMSHANYYYKALVSDASLRATGQDVDMNPCRWPMHLRGVVQPDNHVYPNPYQSAGTQDAPPTRYTIPRSGCNWAGCSGAVSFEKRVSIIIVTTRTRAHQLWLITICKFCKHFKSPLKLTSAAFLNPNGDICT